MTTTIAAVATPRGEGGIAIVRVSGGRAEAILKEAFRPARKSPRFPVPYRMTYGRCVDGNGETIDECMAVFMRAPRSYTREDVIEIHCHGGAYAAGRVLGRVLDLGARPAQPGEFTRRAFENGRVDLMEAEAVMDVIAARGEAALRSSVRALEGGASAMIRACRERLTDILSRVEAADDFPDEIDEDVTAVSVAEGARETAKRLRGHIDERAARAIREGVSVVLCGRPNVGKSSLMNALCGRERAIVTDIPGTTRDVLTETLSIDGVPVELSDTAGQRDTADAIERVGVERARQAQRGADVILIVLDASAPLTDDDRRLLETRDSRCVTVLNKWDIACAGSEDVFCDVRLSAKTGEGVERLLALLSERIGLTALDEALLTNERHVAAARQAAALLEGAADALEGGVPVDVASVDIWEARRLLGELTGEDAAESVIDAVFARFCVGK